MRKINKKLSELVLESFYFVSEQTRHLIDEYGLLFILYDSGETEALKPLFSLLEKCHLSYQIITLGTSARILANHAKVLSFSSPKIIESLQQTTTYEWQRESMLSEETISDITDQISSGFIVTGMASKVQFQIANRLAENQAHIFSYYDSFAPIKKDSIAFPFLKISQEVFVPTKTLEKNVNQFNEKAKAHIVGQPSIENWIDEYGKINAQSLYNELHIPNNRFTLLYAGGYGTHYEKAFRLFLRSISRLDKLNIVLSLHPKMDGQLEKSLIKEEGCDFIKIADKQIPTNVLVKIADLVVSQNSTVGIQALFVHKPVIYLDTPESTYTNFAIEGGWVAQVFTKQEFVKLLESGVTKHTPTKLELYHGMGIPKKASTLIFNRIQYKAKSRTFIQP